MKRIERKREENETKPNQTKPRPNKNKITKLPIYFSCGLALRSRFSIFTLIERKNSISHDKTSTQLDQLLSQPEIFDE